MAHRTLFRRYPRRWWEDLADELAQPRAQDHLPWTMERLWHAVLTDPGVPFHHHTIGGWFGPTHEALFDRTLAAVPDGGACVEVGAWHGRSTCYALARLLADRKRVRYTVVDHFRGSSGPGDMTGTLAALEPGGTVRPLFERSVAPLTKHRPVEVMETDSLTAASFFAPASLDWVYLDGAHTEADVAADVAAWLPKLKPGGWCVGDDWAYCWPGVQRAVEKAFGAKVDLSCAPAWAHRVPPA
jgi:predicted O-methyltransferase YrrM